MSGSSLRDQLPPQFGLYGEPTRSLDPGYVHIEDIASRSRRLGWTIRPHRHANLFQVLHLADGEMEIRLDSESRHLSAPCSVTLPVGVVHGFQFQADTRGKVLSVATDLLETPAFARELESLLKEPRLLTWQQDGDRLQRFAWQLDELQTELDDALSGFETAMEWQVGRILMTLTRALNRAAREQSEFGSRSNAASRTAESFRALVDETYAEHLSMQEYASRLHVSLSSLNRHCQSRFGTTPKELLHNRLMREAKRRLVYTQATAEQIGFALGFEDAAYFSRFFAQRAGLSPGAYRKRHSRRT